MEMELKGCHKAEIYSPEQEFLCTAEVVRAAYDNYRLVVPLDFEVSSELEYYEVVFYDAFAGLVHTLCRLSDPLHISKSQQSLLCVVREEREREQRRQDLKVPAEAAIEVTCTRMPAGEKRLPARIQSKVRNISAGGIYFYCQYPIPKGTIVQFQLHEASKPLQLTARVLRKEELEPLENGTPQFGHGCQFLDLKPNAEAELRSYIFRKELQMRQRMRRE
jgi:hypothetical protein